MKKTQQSIIVLSDIKRGEFVNKTTATIEDDKLVIHKQIFYTVMGCPTGSNDIIELDMDEAKSLGKFLLGNLQI